MTRLTLILLVVWLAGFVVLVMFALADLYVEKTIEVWPDDEDPRARHPTETFWRQMATVIAWPLLALTPAGRRRLRDVVRGD